MKSIIQTDKTYCYICGMNNHVEPLDEHHVFFGTANRKKSEQWGLKVYIHHWKCHLNGVHADIDLDLALKERVQRIAMEHYGWNVDDFRAIFGKSYI